MCASLLELDLLLTFATLFYNGIEIQTLSSNDFLPCQVSGLELNSGMTVELISDNQAEARHLMSATLGCSSAVFMLTGPSQA